MFSNTVFLIIGSVLFMALAVMYGVNIFKKKLKNRWFIAPIYTLIVMALALISQISWFFGLGVFIYFIDSKLHSMDEKDAKAERMKALESADKGGAAEDN